MVARRLLLPTLFVLVVHGAPLLGATDPVPVAGASPVAGTAAPAPAPPVTPATGAEARPTTLTDPTTGMEFVFVRGGCYRMGDLFGIGEPDEKPVHEVCVKDFYLGKYEVTQAQWQRVTGRNQATFSACGPTCPVDNVSWNDVQNNFIKKLNQLSGAQYRLPTEAEWEYACRSGGREEKNCGGDDPGPLAWFMDTAGVSTHPVGQRQPNGLGLYDMSGNVWELVQDRYGKAYYGASPKDNPTGPTTGTFRTARGGSWFFDPRGVRSTGRYRVDPTDRFNIMGFRLLAPVPDAAGVTPNRTATPPSK